MPFVTFDDIIVTIGPDLWWWFFVAISNCSFFFQIHADWIDLMCSCNFLWCCSWSKSQSEKQRGIGCPEEQDSRYEGCSVLAIHRHSRDYFPVMGSRTRAFWLLFTLNLDGYCKRRTVKTTKDVQCDLRFMSQDLKVRNQWKHSGAIACNTWNVWCRTPRSITFASGGGRGKRGNYTCKVAMETERRVCVRVCVCQSSEAPSFSTCDGGWRVIEFQVNGSQLAFCRQSARLTGNTNHSLVSPTRFTTFWRLASRGWLITDISASANGTLQLFGLNPCHFSAYCLYSVCLSPQQFPWMCSPQTPCGAASMNIWERDKPPRSQLLTLTPAVGESTSPCWRAVACPSDCQVLSTGWDSCNFSHPVALSTHAGVFFYSFHPRHSW